MSKQTGNTGTIPKSHWQQYIDRANDKIAESNFLGHLVPSLQIEEETPQRGARYIDRVVSSDVKSYTIIIDMRPGWSVSERTTLLTGPRWRLIDPACVRKITLSTRASLPESAVRLSAEDSAEVLETVNLLADAYRTHPDSRIEHNGLVLQRLHGFRSAAFLTVPRGEDRATVFVVEVYGHQFYVPVEKLQADTLEDVASGAAAAVETALAHAEDGDKRLLDALRQATRKVNALHDQIYRGMKQRQYWFSCDPEHAFPRVYAFDVVAVKKGGAK